MAASPVVVWFRSDLRLADNPALEAAATRGAPVLPVFVWAPDEEGDWAPGAASRWWLRESLRELGRSLEESGSRLLLRRGPSAAAIESLLDETGAEAVYWNACAEPGAEARDRRLRAALEGRGTEVRCFQGSLLFDPRDTGKKDGTPYRVFTPFWNALRRREVPSPAPAPTLLPAPPAWPAGLRVEELELDVPAAREQGWRGAWKPGERGARARLAALVDGVLAGYPETRDAPSREGTSRLSPHLRFGEVGARTAWRAVRDAAERHAPGLDRQAESWLRQFAWREFAFHLLVHFPHTPTDPLREEFRHFEWAPDDGLLVAWQQGRTGYPLVDAGMRELLETGWMHNRARMVAASFLVKDLRQSWQQGARWFWENLVDADLANNTLGWQWTAGCGADAAPFHRVFNPTLQSRRFDPDGDYIRRWVPELVALDAKSIHEPATAPATRLRGAGVRIGDTYPRPVVAHDEARRLALEAYRSLLPGD